MSEHRLLLLCKPTDRYACRRSVSFLPLKETGMNKITRTFAVAALFGVLGAAPAFAAEVNRGRETSDSTERSPGEGVPGKVPDCNPNASNCDTLMQLSPLHQDQTSANPNGAGIPANQQPPAIDAAVSRKRLSPGIDAKGDVTSGTSPASESRSGSFAPTQNGSGNGTSSTGTTGGNATGSGSGTRSAGAGGGGR